jgi:hypothetical protein
VPSFTPSAQPAPMALVGGDLEGCGEYDGTLYAGKSTIDGTDLTLPQGLTAGASVLIVNLEEDSGITDHLGNAMEPGSHRLKAGTYVHGTIYGMSKEATPRPQFFVRGGVGDTGSPINLVSSGNSAADVHDWSRLRDGVPVGLVPLGQVFWDTTEGKLYQYSRTVDFDSRGLLYHVGAEERNVIDLPVDCGS